MNHRMVLAALGAPENKMREQQSGDPNGSKYEEWIYGHVPQTIRFVRFVGDRVAVVEIAELGKPLVIHDKDEMGGFNGGPETRQVAMGDQQPTDGTEKTPPPPSLRLPGEQAPDGGPNKVQFPDDKDQKTKVAPIPPPPSAPQPLPQSPTTVPQGRNPSVPNPTTEPQFVP